LLSGGGDVDRITGDWSLWFAIIAAMYILAKSRLFRIRNPGSDAGVFRNDRSNLHQLSLSHAVSPSSYEIIMSEPQIAPYGKWTSPITAEHLSSGSVHLEGIQTNVPLHPAKPHHDNQVYQS
jgi:hypothetical protein